MASLFLIHAFSTLNPTNPFIRDARKPVLYLLPRYSDILYILPGASLDKSGSVLKFLYSCRCLHKCSFCIIFDVKDACTIFQEIIFYVITVHNIPGGNFLGSNIASWLPESIPPPPEPEPELEPELSSSSSSVEVSAQADVNSFMSALFVSLLSDTTVSASTTLLFRYILHFQVSRKNYLVWFRLRQVRIH